MATYQQQMAAAMQKQLEAESAAKLSKDQQAKIGYETTSKQYEEAYNQAKRMYDTQKMDVESVAAANAKSAYTNKMMQEKTLPNVLQRSGLAGQGVAETTANSINTGYQNSWNQVMSDKGKGIRDINMNDANSFSQYQQGLAGAGGQYQQNLVGNEGDFQSRSLSLQAQYQQDLARYLESLKKTGSGGTGALGGDVKTNPELAKIRNGMNQIPFDPSKGIPGYQNLKDYLAPYIKAKKITQDQANAWINELLTLYASRQNSSAGTTKTGVQTQQPPSGGGTPKPLPKSSSGNNTNLMY